MYYRYRDAARVDQVGRSGNFVGATAMGNKASLRCWTMEFSWKHNGRYRCWVCLKMENLYQTLVSYIQYNSNMAHDDQDWSSVQLSGVFLPIRFPELACWRTLDCFGSENGEFLHPKWDGSPGGYRRPGRRNFDIVDYCIYICINYHWFLWIRNQENLEFQVSLGFVRK